MASTTEAPDLALRRQRFGWYAYRWASHTFETTVVTVFMSRCLPAVAENAVGRNGRLHVLGIPVLLGSGDLLDGDGPRNPNASGSHPRIP
jgi:MFS-type transporter involved in bile tolerance (Atg22 family)